MYFYFPYPVFTCQVPDWENILSLMDGKRQIFQEINQSQAVETACCHCGRKGARIRGVNPSAKDWYTGYYIANYFYDK